MATKGTNAKIKELKGVKPEKVTTEQLEKVQTAVNEINKYQLEIGSIEVQKNQLVQHVGQLRSELTSLQVEFEKDYGTYDIDIATGTINYPENGEVNKKD
tara:strand:+ start:1889 stop:2188 length:300 start_codon:yes stop_codon:yes gene_type:complete